MASEQFMQAIIPLIFKGNKLRKRYECKDLNKILQ